MDQRSIWNCRGSKSRVSSSSAEAASRVLDGPLSRRRFSALLLSSAVLPLITGPAFAETLFPDGLHLFAPSSRQLSYPIYDETVRHVLPEDGFQSQIALKDSVLRLVDNGVIDRGKYFELYLQQGSHSEALDHVLDRSSNEPILLTRSNATEYVNLLWPIGLATHMEANATSPINDSSLNSFASTGGWSLGRADSGGGYFDKYPIVVLSKEEEARVVRIASSTYRPCCNNSTFFQDCNHGSALLGLLQLGASQGLNDNQLYREALAFNSFWFGDYYVRTALFFKVIKKNRLGGCQPTDRARLRLFGWRSVAREHRDPGGIDLGSYSPRAGQWRQLWRVTSGQKRTCYSALDQLPSSGLGTAWT